MLPKPWDRRKGESERAYEAFSAYLEMSSRSIQKVADLLSKKRQQINTWSRKYEWRERAAAYDSSIVEALRKEKIKRRKKIAEKMDTAGNLMVDRAIEAFKAVSIQRISPRTATEMADVGSRLVIQSLDLENLEGTGADSTLTINIVSAEEGEGD